MSTRSLLKTVLLQLIFSVSLLPSISFSLPCDDNRCKTDSCDEKGTCICNLPDPSTILDGDRPFLGGRFCDEKQIMCDGTNSFWCANGGSCEEIVQGENYTCRCPPGFAGLHCEHIGAPCGEMFCFHQAECLIEGQLCGCPIDWKGSLDCSLPSPNDGKDTSTTNRISQDETEDSEKWSIVVIGGVCSSGLVFAAIFYIKCLKKREIAVSKFQQLSQMHIDGVLDDDDDGDAQGLLVPVSISNNREHL